MAKCKSCGAGSDETQLCLVCWLLGAEKNKQLINSTKDLMERYPYVDAWSNNE